MYATIDVIQGKQGEKRLVISLNGKVSRGSLAALATSSETAPSECAALQFLPHVEQKVEDNTAKPPK